MHRYTLALLLMTLASPALAHEGHDHSGGKFDNPAQADSAAPLTLTEAAIHNLDIQTAPASLKSVSETLSVLAQVALAPEKQATIAPRFVGKVMRLEAKLGQAVTRGQPLVTLEPLSIGNAPVILTAPAGGYISAVRAVLGQVVEAGTDLIEIGNTGQVLARGSVYESPVVHRLHPGLPVTLILDSLPGQTFSGTLERFDRVINPASRTFDVYAQLQGETSSLLQGLQGEMTIALGTPQDRLMIPKKAVLGDSGNLFVFVRDGHTFERRPVTLGQRSGAEVEVIEGVLPDEAVVIRGNYQLQYM